MGRYRGGQSKDTQVQALTRCSGGGGGWEGWLGQEPWADLPLSPAGDQSKLWSLADLITQTSMCTATWAVETCNWHPNESTWHGVGVCHVCEHVTCHLMLLCESPWDCA